MEPRHCVGERSEPRCRALVVSVRTSLHRIQLCRHTCFVPDRRRCKHRDSYTAGHPHSSRRERHTAAPKSGPNTCIQSARDPCRGSPRATKALHRAHSDSDRCSGTPMDNSASTESLPSRRGSDNADQRAHRSLECDTLLRSSSSRSRHTYLPWQVEGRGARVVRSSWSSFCGVFQATSHPKVKDENRYPSGPFFVSYRYSRN